MTATTWTPTDCPKCRASSTVELDVDGTLDELVAFMLGLVDVVRELNARELGAVDDGELPASLLRVAHRTATDR